MISLARRWGHRRAISGGISGFTRLAGYICQTIDFSGATGVACFCFLEIYDHLMVLESLFKSLNASNQITLHRGLVAGNFQTSALKTAFVPK